MSGGGVRGLRQEVASGRELAVLVGGPWLPAWYWRDELEAMQAASRRYPDGHASAVLRGYYPTDEWRPHPSTRPATDEADSEEERITGRVWRYRPPPGARRTRDSDRWGRNSPGKNRGGEVTWTQRR